MARQVEGPGRTSEPHGGMNPVAELVVRSFAVRTFSHLAHLRSRSYSEHVALGSFYDDLIPAVDEFVEIHQAQGLIEDYPPAQATDLTTPPADALAEYHDWLKDNYAACCGGDPALENIMDGLIGLTARTIYKLKFLK